MVVSTMLGGIRPCKLEGLTIISGYEKYELESIKEIDINIYRYGYYIIIILFVLLTYPFVIGIYGSLISKDNNTFDFVFISCIAIITIVACGVVIRSIKRVKDYKYVFVLGMGVSVFFDESDSNDDYKYLKSLCK